MSGQDPSMDDSAIPFRAGSDPPAGFFLLILVRAGAMRLSCDAGDLSLVPGSLILVPPGSRPRLREAPGTESSAFCFGRSLLDAFAAESAIDLAIETLAATSPLVARLSGRDVQEAASLFSALEREAEQMRPGYLPMVRLKLMEIVLLLGRNLEGRAVPGGGLPREEGREHQAPVHFNAAELRRYLEERYADQLTLDDLARHFGLNPAYLSRAFSRESGSTIVEFLNGIRIRKSCAMLKRSRASIMEISVAVGYNNLSHFNRCFRRITGMSPRDWRIRSQR